MSRVPGAELAIVEERKIVEYLLAFDHPVGKSKAAFFSRFGFRREAPDDLRSALLTHVRYSDVQSVETTQFGTKYVAEGALLAPNGAVLRVRTVWFIEADEEVPRLVTAYPAQRR